MPSSLRHCFLETINENQKELRFAPCLGNLLKKVLKVAIVAQVPELWSTYSKDPGFNPTH